MNDTLSSCHQWNSIPGAFFHSYRHLIKWPFTSLHANYDWPSRVPCSYCYLLDIYSKKLGKSLPTSPIFSPMGSQPSGGTFGDMVKVLILPKFHTTKATRDFYPTWKCWGCNQSVFLNIFLPLSSWTLVDVKAKPGCSEEWMNPVKVARYGDKYVRASKGQPLSLDLF